MTTRARRPLLAAILAAVLLVAAGCSAGGADQASTARQKITMLTGFGKLGQDAYLYLGRDKGWFTEQGIDLDIEAGTGTDGNLKLVLAGKAQFATIDMTGGLIAYGKGTRDFTTVTAIYQRSVSSITTLQGSGIKAPRDLAGRTIGYAPGGVNFALFPAYAKLAGLDARTVQWKVAQPQTLRGLLTAGKVDAITETVIGTPGVEAAAHRQAVVLPYSNYLSDLYGNIVITAASTATDTDLVHRFRTALLRSLVYAVEHPAEAGASFHHAVPAYPQPAATAETTLMANYVQPASGAGTLEPARVMRSIALLQTQGLVPEGITPDAVLNRDVRLLTGVTR